MLVFDASDFAALTADDAVLQSELLAIFQTQIPHLLEDAAVASPREFGHKLRGLAANLAAPELKSVAERWTGQGDPQALDDLRAALTRLEAELAAHVTIDVTKAV
ncbi:MAG: hypothetical protein AAFY73_11235 [Pseudomonadota bacterium]